MNLSRLIMTILLVAGTLATPVPGAARDLPVVNPALIADEEARERLSYLASCALDADSVLVGSVNGTEYRFPGAMALAPDWGVRAMTRAERRWVSACILARTNAFGAHVLLSMRADPAPVVALGTGPEERASHTIYEGGFFGDIFSDPPRAFVCARHDVGAAAVLERLQRVCALPAGSDPRVSHCGFAIVAPCEEGMAPMIAGTPWPEVIHVWLNGAAPTD